MNDVARTRKYNLFDVSRYEVIPPVDYKHSREQATATNHSGEVTEMVAGGSGRTPKGEKGKRMKIYIAILMMPVMAYILYKVTE